MKKMLMIILEICRKTVEEAKNKVRQYVEYSKGL